MNRHRSVIKGKKGREPLAFLCGVLLLICGCTKATQPVLVTVYSYQPGINSTTSPVAMDSNGNYELLNAYTQSNMNDTILPIIDITFPFPTHLILAVDRTVIQEEENPVQQANLETQNIGYYSVLHSNVNSANGLTEFEILVVPPITKLQGYEFDIQIEDVSADTANVASDLVSPALVIPIVQIESETGPCPYPGHGNCTTYYKPSPYTPQQAAWYGGNNCGFWPTPGYGAPGNGPGGYGNTDADAAAYYAAVDPANQKLTLADWKTANGFDPNDNSADTAYAIYLNAADLGLGRSMHMKVQGANVAYYVSNYQTVEDARLGTNLIATVAMDYSPVKGTNGGNPFIKFFVFDYNGVRRPGANLDGCGIKNVPALCQICHNGGGPAYTAPGVAGPHDANVNARFLPFDLDNFKYSTAGGLSRSNQEAMFQLLNYYIVSANPSKAETELIQGWYPCLGKANCTQNSSFVPPGWAASPSNSYYLNGVKLSCRTCHVSRDYPYDWSTAAIVSSATYGPQVVQHVCQSSPASLASLAMPQSKVTYLDFWLSQTLPGQHGFINITAPTGGIPANILAAANQPNVGHCPDY